MERRRGREEEDGKGKCILLYHPKTRGNYGGNHVQDCEAHVQNQVDRSDGGKLLLCIELNSASEGLPLTVLPQRTCRTASILVKLCANSFPF